MPALDGAQRANRLGVLSFGLFPLNEQRKGMAGKTQGIPGESNEKGDGQTMLLEKRGQANNAPIVAFLPVLQMPSAESAFPFNLSWSRYVFADLN